MHALLLGCSQHLLRQTVSLQIPCGQPRCTVSHEMLATSHAFCLSFCKSLAASAGTLSIYEALAASHAWFLSAYKSLAARLQCQALTC